MEYLTIINFIFIKTIIQKILQQMAEETAKTILEFVTEIQKSESGRYERVVRCEQCNCECFVNENYDEEIDYVVCDICEYNYLLNVIQLTDKQLQPELQNTIDDEIFCGNCINGHFGCNEFCKHLQMDDYDDESVTSSACKSDYSYDSDDEIVTNTPTQHTDMSHAFSNVFRQIFLPKEQQPIKLPEETPLTVACEEAIVEPKEKPKYVPKKCPHGRLKWGCVHCKGGGICEHSTRKNTCKQCNGKDICEHNTRRRTCRKCKGNGICPHGRDKARCTKCGTGSQICPHGKYKRFCAIPPCNGSRLCEHKRQKAGCRECGTGSQICKHGKQKAYCRECGSQYYCTHGRWKYSCIECMGSQVCEHKILRRSCKICHGSQICEHDIHKMYCRLCHGSQICEHNNVKRHCKQCHGSGICEHDVQRRFCTICMGTSVCEHKKNKYRCKICDGRSLCKSTWCETRGNPKYDGYCVHCFIHLFPDEPRVINYRNKEFEVVHRVKTALPNYTWILNKNIADGCSKRRPDMFLDMGTHIIIIEIDEHRHTDYDESCETMRTMELSKDVNFRPIVFIRFNPDEYRDDDGKLIPSCWRINGLRILQISIDQFENWENRIESLLQHTNHFINNPTTKTIEIVHLFY